MIKGFYGDLINVLLLNHNVSLRTSLQRGMKKHFFSENIVSLAWNYLTHIIVFNGLDECSAIASEAAQPCNDDNFKSLF